MPQDKQYHRQVKAGQRYETMISQKKILVVEDNEINRMILREILSPQYKVLEAGDGAEALSVLREYGEMVSLILLDIVMSTIASQSIGKAVKLQQVLINILSNTIKFTKEGGKVAFSASQRRKTKNDAPSAGSFWYIGMSRMNFCRSGSGMCRSAGWPRQLRPHTRC